TSLIFRMDNFSAGTVSSPSLRRKTYQLLSSVTGLSDCRFRHVVHRFRQHRKSGRLPVGIGGRFRLESLVDLNRNQWTTSIGIGGRLAPEYSKDRALNTNGLLLSYSPSTRLLGFSSDLLLIVAS